MFHSWARATKFGIPFARDVIDDAHRFSLKMFSVM